MKRREPLRIVLGLLLLLGASVPLEAAQSPIVLLTADRAGALKPCSDCPGDKALGGAARMATLLREQRDSSPTLLVDAGNAFFGSADSSGDSGVAVRDLYGALGYDVVNVGFRDFREGLETTRALLRDAPFTCVSVNLQDEKGELLFQPYVAVGVGDSTVAVFGVTQKPPGIEYLPHLKRQLAGVQIADPLEALEEWLLQATKGEYHVVVLCYGDIGFLRSVQARFGDEVAAVCVGGTRPGELQESKGATLAAAEPEGRGLTRLTLGDDTAPIFLAVDAALAPDLQIEELLAVDLAPATIQLEEISRSLTPDAKFEEGVALELDARSAEPGFGSGLILRVSSAQSRSSWQGLEAPAGKSWLVFDLEVENDIPASLAFGSGREAGEKLLVVLRQKLFLLCGEDARTTLPRFLPKKPIAPEALLAERSVLNFVGDATSGEVAFAVHPSVLENGSLQLRLYHDEVSMAAVNVRGAVPAGDVEPAQENVYVAMAEPTVRFPVTIDGEQPPAGTRWVEATIVGRSQNAKPAFYLEGASHLELLTNGLWARRAKEGHGSLPADPIFLPDRFTGGTAVFLAPIEAHSLELSVGFPLLVLEDGERVVPEAVRFLLEGELAPPEPDLADVHIQDKPLPLEIIAVERRETFGDLRAQEGRTLLVLDCRIANSGTSPEDGGMYGPKDRFLLEGATHALTTDLTGVALAEPFLIPAGGRRAFRVVLDAPAGLPGTAEITYSGVSVRQPFSIDVREGEEAAPIVPTAEDSAAPDASAEKTAPDPSELAADWSLHAMTPPPASQSGEPGLIDIKPVSHTQADLTLLVRSAAFHEERNGVTATEGEVYFELDIELQLGGSAEAILIKDLRQRVFGVLDGRLELAMKVLRQEGALPNRLELEPGASLSGTVLFLVPRAGFSSFSLELDLLEGGVLHAPVIAAAEPSSPAFAIRKNRAVEVELIGFEALDEIDGKSPARGKQFVALELRARNHLEGDAKPAGRLPWRETRRRLQLVLDGLDAFSPRRLHSPLDLPEASILFPEETLGGRVVFELPRDRLAQSKSAELVCGFEPAERPGGGLIDLASLRFPLFGKSPQIELPEGLTSLEDRGVTLGIGPLERTETVFGTGPSSGKTWLTTDLWFQAGEAVSNAIAQPKRSFAIVDAQGETYAMNNATWRVHTPSHRGAGFWIPDGGTRRFTAVFQVPVERLEGGAFLVRSLMQATLLPLEAGQSIDAPAADLTRATNGQVVFDASLESQGLEGVGLDPALVNRAIDRGRDFLWDQLQQGMRKGKIAETTFNVPAILALVHCKAHELYPEFDAALRRWIEARDLKKHGVYELSLIAMILDAYDDPSYAALLRSSLMFLVESQGLGGSWNYKTRLRKRLLPEVSDETPESMPFTLEVSGGEAPEERASGPDILRRTQSWSLGTDGDNSVSQFAVLGLGAMDPDQLAIDVDVWERILQVYTERQALSAGPTQGGFGYTSGAAYGSMTCAGICSLAIALRRADASLDPREDLRIRDALAWLEREWKVAENPKNRQWPYYYLYGIERVGRILGIEFIGKYEWYPLGAKHLVGAQSADGSWTGPGTEADPRIASSFALLFLTRATESLKLDEEPEPEPEGPGSLQTVFQAPPGSDNVYVILDGSGSMLAKVGEQKKFDIARDAVRGLIAGLPDETSFALRVYGHTKRSIEDGAEEDTALVVPFAPLKRDKLGETLMALRPRGKTPLTLSLEQARRDLSKAPRDRDTLVILLTDGGEDTRKDPVAAAAAWKGLASSQLFIVGFDINRPDWTQQLRAMAEASEGRYIDVAEAQQLSADLRGIVVPQPPAFEVRDAAGELAFEGEFGESVELDEGDYEISFRVKGEVVQRSFHVRPGRTVRVNLDLRSR